MHATRPSTRFVFEDSVSVEDIRDALDVALASVRGIHGRPAFELEAHHQFEPETREIRVATGAPVGRDLARALYELASGSLGRESFTLIASWGAW